jgi:hypothetical protein
LSQPRLPFVSLANVRRTTDTRDVAKSATGGP